MSIENSRAVATGALPRLAPLRYVRTDALTERVTSQDGTAIAYDRLGAGPAVILVGGASVDRSANAGLAERLAAHLTVHNYDRRGRGPSGDTPPYAPEREIEDLEAVIGAAGGSAHLFGSSSGAALALLAAASGTPIAKLALWEPPFVPDDGTPRPPHDTAAVFRRLVAEGRRGDAVEYFMTRVVGLPPKFAAQARSAPWWPAQEALAHTLAYDAEIMGDYSLPKGRAARVTVPTLVLCGDMSFPFLATTAAQLAAAVPDERTQILEGQSHDVDPDVLAPALTAFFRG